MPWGPVVTSAQQAQNKTTPLFRESCWYGLSKWCKHRTSLQMVSKRTTVTYLHFSFLWLLRICALEPFWWKSIIADIANFSKYEGFSAKCDQKRLKSAASRGLKISRSKWDMNVKLCSGKTLGFLLSFREENVPVQHKLSDTQKTQGENHRISVSSVDVDFW